MKLAATLLFLPLLQLHCASATAISTPPAHPSCTPGTYGDPSREARIRTLLARDAAAAQLVKTEQIAVCFGGGFQRGVLSGDVAFLDANSGDGELAARLGHLLIHHRDKLGDGCAAGLAAARDSESRAARLELHLLTRLGLPPLPTSSDSASTQDYTQRCRDGRAI